MLFNRHHIRAFWQALLVLLAFASCINDDFADDTTCVDTDGTPWYLGLQLQFDASESSTRATGNTFESGTHEEHKIGPKGNYVILFDGDGNLFGVYPLTMTVQDKVHNDTPDNEIREGDYLRLVHVYSRNGKLPESCLVVLNASDDFCKKLDEYDRKRFKATLSEVLEEVWYDDEKPLDEKKPEDIGFADSEHKYFTMTNSIYLDGTDKKDVVSVKNNIYPTIQEAINKPTTVYVERMVAKMSFFKKGEGARTDEKGYYKLRDTWNDSGDIRPDLTSDEQVWLYDGYDDSDNAKDPDDPNDLGNLKIKNITPYCRIQVTGWGFNALETESHFFKKIESKQYFDGYSWSDATKYRSYWSEDPHYAESYPWQYRYAVDNRDIGHYSDVHNPSPLKNYSYNEFYKGLDVNEDVVYIPENTYGEDVLKADYDGRTNLLAGTHLIVCAELLIDKVALEKPKEGEIIIPGSEYRTIDLYRDRIGVYYKKQVDCLAELVRQFNHDLKSQSTMKFDYYDWTVNSTDSKTTDEHDNTRLTAKCTGDYQLYYGDEVLTPAKVRELAGEADITLSTAYVKDGDGKLLPWTDGWINDLTIKNSKGDQLKIYAGDYDLAEEELKEHNNTHNQGKDEFKYQKLKEPVRETATTNDIKSLLLEWVGAIDYFNQGKMYYAAPVLHNAASDPKTANMQKLGHFGVVRNHWYKFTLTDILRLGTPVSEPEEPIVPNRVKTNDQLNLKVEIINWHEIGTTLPIL